MSCGTNWRCTAPSLDVVWGSVARVWFTSVGERKITTLEGLIENGKPNKLQQAFIDEQAAQCGYCISGMVMRAETLLRVNPRPTDDEIRQHMRPNLCRCGTHAAIMRAIKRAAVA
jgi:nicotinate dehydrogenase subunit A